MWDRRNNLDLVTGISLINLNQKPETSALNLNVKIIEEGHSTIYLKLLISSYFCLAEDDQISFK